MKAFARISRSLRWRAQTGHLDSRTPTLSYITRSFAAGRGLDQNHLLDPLAVTDLFAQYAKKRAGIDCLDRDDIRELRRGIGDTTDDEVVERLFEVADLNGDGSIDYHEFIEHADIFLGDNPARIILIVGGPGSVCSLPVQTNRMVAVD